MDLFTSDSRRSLITAAPGAEAGGGKLTSIHLYYSGLFHFLAHERDDRYDFFFVGSGNLARL